MYTEGAVVVYGGGGGGGGIPAMQRLKLKV